MMSPLAARLSFVVCLLAATAAPGKLVRAQETLVWTDKASEGFVSLTYGSLDATKQPKFLLSCFNEMGIAVLDIFGVIQGTRPGEKLIIEFSGGSSLSLEGAVELDTKSGSMFAEASEIEVKPLLEVLKSPGPVTVKMAATTLTLSDTGRAEAAERFGRNCKLD
ncbi:MAG TPA: hypothetical protein VLB11_08725 [Methyloceanibacter sp.]|nr:hypothetical protein [Methyloceanibacter sp.]